MGKSQALRPRILLDCIAFDEKDGGFSEAIARLLAATREINSIEFGVVCPKRYFEWFRQRSTDVFTFSGFRSTKFLDSYWITPRIAAKHGYQFIHSDISLVSNRFATRSSIKVHDLYFLINKKASPDGSIRRIKNKLFEHLYINSIRQSKVVCCISETTRKDVGRLLGRYKNVSVIYPAVDDCIKSGLVNKRSRNPETLNILFVGSIVPRKNLNYLIEALAFLNRPWKLDIVGNVWWGAKDLSIPKAIERVKIHGFVSNDHLSRLYKHADIFVMPSLYEGFCVPVVEAIKHGCLAITSDESVFKEYIQTECRFDLSDVRSFARIVNNLTPEIISNNYNIQKQSVSGFNFKNQVLAYEQHFRALVKTQ